MLTVHVDEASGAELSAPLDELVAEGARWTQAAAFEAEVDTYVTSLADERDDEVAGERCRSRSSIRPPWARKSPKVAEVLPLIYLHGMSSGYFAPALEESFASSAGLSASVVTRVTTGRQKERDQFADRPAKDVDYVDLWTDEIHFNVRLERARLRALVIVVCALTGLSWSRSATGTGSRPGPGPRRARELRRRSQ